VTITTTASPKRFLVTAGNTREKIDAVRDWGNMFTGNTGLAIAKALASVGEVDLLTSNRAHIEELSRAPAAPFPIHASGYFSHEQLKGSLAALMARAAYDAVFMTAAVADYRPSGVYEVLERNLADAGHETWVVRDVQAGKVKSTYGTIAVLGRPTEKLVDLFRAEWRHRGLLVKFKLEVGVSPEELVRIGEASRRASGANYLVANALAMLHGDAAGAYLLSDAGHEWVARGDLPARMVQIVTSAR
jgi:phosphopantothenoylcysteine synthetase/decarboxylase